jgi:capsular polysaccharide biosynthesis protein
MRCQVSFAVGYANTLTHSLSAPYHRPQIRLFRRSTVLIGVHGSALINSPFMARGACPCSIHGVQ